MARQHDPGQFSQKKRCFPEFAAKQNFVLFTLPFFTRYLVVVVIPFSYFHIHNSSYGLL